MPDSPKIIDAIATHKYFSIDGLFFVCSNPKEITGPRWNRGRSGRGRRCNCAGNTVPATRVAIQAASRGQGRGGLHGPGPRIQWQNGRRAPRYSKRSIRPDSTTWPIRPSTASGPSCLSAHNPTVLKLAADIGFEAIDAGSLVIARLLEPYGILWIYLTLERGMGRDLAPETWGPAWARSGQQRATRSCSASPRIRKSCRQLPPRPVPEKRVARLREFWEIVSTAPFGVGYLPSIEIKDEFTHRWVNQLSSLGTLLGEPRVSPPVPSTRGSPDVLSYYDAAP